MSKVKDHYCYGEVQYGEFDVEKDRDKYIGGSDLPVIMGISSFKKRFDLLLEKAGLQESNFHGNKYTQYGHDMEPIIRDYVNSDFGAFFQPARIINGDLRFHMDGFESESVLEIKTTSDIHATVAGYKDYLVQLIRYMAETGADFGVLAVYARPEDMSLVFDRERLQIFNIRLKDYIPLLNKINEEIDRFRADLKRLKENPLLTEQDFLPAGQSLVAMANKVVAFENQLAMLKEVEQQCKEAKKQLYMEMQKHGVKSWTSPGGTKITMVEETPATTKKVTEFNLELFKQEHPAMHKRYLQTHDKATPGKSGFVRITVPKG